MSIISFTRNRRGIALFNIVFLLVFIGVLVGAGAKMYGSMVVRGKVNDTKGELEREVQMITAWAVKNGRLPTATDYPGVFGTTPMDAWGKQIHYIHDAGLTATASGGLCGRTATGLSNNAFALVSGGDDFNIQSTADGTVIDSSKAATAFAPDQSDLYRVVTLEELKSKAGCYGPTGGRLRIVNNELPNACTGNAYSATIFADGGVTPYVSYSITGLPAGLAASGATISGAPAASGTSSVTVTVTDSHAPSPNSVTRAYSLKSASCASPPETYITLNPASGGVADNWNGGTANDQGTNNTDAASGKFNMTVTDGTLSAISLQNGTTASCIWFQRPLTLNGKIMRAYFQFKYDMGSGFVFAMVPALGRQTIDSCDENAFMGFGSGIPGTTLLGAQFQVNDRNDGVGPGSTCVSTTSATCTPVAPGINNWTTGTTYYVRAELDTTVTTNFVYRVWMSSDSAYRNAFKNLSTNYSNSLPAPITRTTPLNSTNYSDISTFFIGFTTGQHGNDNVSMTASDLRFVLY
ncbi:MAG: hypothetical protein HYV06_02910 [Deltaproteobacteria bacterium]|nr:hypothetical protein [Deltaproteobacteria bacterium]